MRIRFYNAKLLTMAGSHEITSGELWVEDDRIALLGEPTETMPPFDREIDAKGNLLMPGLKNAHTHSAMTFLRSYGDGLPLQRWLTEKVFPREAKLTADDVYWFTKVALLEYISGGTTSVFDMYFYPEASVSAATEYGFRFVMCGAGGIDGLEETYDKFNNFHPLISFQLGSHAEYTATMYDLEQISALAKKKQAPVYSHNSETKLEVEGSLERHQKTPTELFSSLGMFQYGGGGFHCVHLSQNDIELLAKQQVYVVANPCSNLKLASGISEVDRLIKAGVPLAIGTDGASSNNALSMWREMYLFSVLQKYLTDDASSVPAEIALQAATNGSARAMQLHDCDCLAVGKQADIIMIDLARPNMQPQNSLINNLVYSASEQNVLLTMIRGKVLYENGEYHIGEQPEKVFYQANQHLQALINRL